MIEGIKLDLADPASQLLGRGEGTRGERRDDRHVHDGNVAELRDDVTAAIDHDGQIRVGLFQEITKDAVEAGDILDR